MTYREIRFDRLAEAWAALSLSLSLLVHYWLWAIVGLLVVLALLLLVQKLRELAR